MLLLSFLSYNDYHKRKITCTLIYIYNAKKAKRFYIQNSDTMQKVIQFALRFHIQKTDTLRSENFHEIFEIGI